VKQSEVNFHLRLNTLLKEKTIDLQLKENVDSPYSRFFLNYSHGFKGLLDSDFKYDKYICTTNNIIGPLGELISLWKWEENFGTVPLGLMRV
jgi:hypothetical protein